jgi:hypothetical protein
LVYARLILLSQERERQREGLITPRMGILGGILTPQVCVCVCVRERERERERERGR